MQRRVAGMVKLGVVALIAACAFPDALAADGVDATYAAYAASVQAALPKQARDDGHAAFDGGKLKDFRLQGEGGAGSDVHYEFQSVTGQGFSTCIHAEIKKTLEPQYLAQILTPTATVAVKKGDNVLAVFSMRRVDAGDGGGGGGGGGNGSGVVSALIQMSSAPWTTLGHEGAVAGREWKTIYVSGRAEQDFAAESYGLAIHLGAQAQTVEIGGVLLLNLGARVDPNLLPFTPITYPGQQADAPWRKAAAERIEKIRKGDLTVHVVGADGKPLAGAAVHATLTRHAFGFGTFLDYEMAHGGDPDSVKLREWTLKLFNRVTTPIYWADWGWENAEIRRKYLETAQWAHDNGMLTRGHVIVYPGFGFMPASAVALEHDPAALRARVAAHVIEVVDATKVFAFQEYDVTNELRDQQDLHRLLGKDVVAEWFKLARAHAAPTTHMAINESTILTSGGLTSANQDNYAGWIQYLIDQGQGPDVIGMQGHFDANVTDPEIVLKTLDRFAKFGKALQITEFDLPTRDEEGQARYTRDFMTVVFSHPAIEAFTMWGYFEGRMWQPPGAMFRKDWTIKPNGQAYMDLVLKQWHTDASGVSGANGVYAVRGFLGDYSVVVSHHGVERKGTAKLVKGGSEVTVKVE